MMNRVLLIVLIALVGIWATVDIYQHAEANRTAAEANKIAAQQARSIAEQTNAIAYPPTPDLPFGGVGWGLKSDRQ